jgi:hypothetical protein
MEDGDDLRWVGFCAVDNHVIWKPGNRPETEGTGREVGTDVSAKWMFGDKGTGIVDRSFDAVGGIFAVPGNAGPDGEEIGPGQGSENVEAHRLDERQSSFIA